MYAKCLVLGLVLATTGCATAPVGTDVAAGAGLGAIAGNLLSAHIRADRAALTAAGALIGGAIGYQRGKAIEGRIAEREAAALRAEGFSPSLTMQAAPIGDERAEVTGPLMQSFNMEVETAEMLTSQGTLQPRAAGALARMADMAREHGGVFSVSVPRSRVETVAAIQAVAPSATIYEGDEDEHYRLSVDTAMP